jgi:hypothetical protein
MRMKKISKTTKGLIAASFLIGIIAIITPVMAAGSNRVLFMAIGDDLDINATNLIVGNIKFGKDDEIRSMTVVFHQRIYEEGEKVYTMMGVIKEGNLVTKQYAFFCPVFQVYFINVWFIMGEGVFKTTDTDYPITYRNWFPITMPNTEGKFVSAPMVMLLSPTGEYCVDDPSVIPPGENNPVETLPGGGWVLPAVLCGIIIQTPDGPTPLPIGPISYLTKAWGI